MKKKPIFLEIQNSFKIKTSIYEEVSFPGHFAEIERPKECEVNYIDYHKGKLKAKGLLSTCIQHEVDHLDGVLFVYHLSKLKKGYDNKKISKTKKRNKNCYIKSMSLKIIFMGTPEFAVPILDSIKIQSTKY